MQRLNITNQLNLQGLRHAQKPVDSSFLVWCLLENLILIVLWFWIFGHLKQITLVHTLFTHWVIIVYLQDYDFWTVRCSNGKTNVLRIRESLEKWAPLYKIFSCCITWRGSNSKSKVFLSCRHYLYYYLFVETRRETSKNIYSYYAIESVKLGVSYEKQN